MKLLNRYILWCAACVAGIAPFACKRDNMGGVPVITNVRAVDSTRRDSSFSEGKPGDLIVIQGSNLGGLQAVYFNDTLATFNPVYATSRNIIVYVPSVAQTVATDPGVSNEIRVVTDHGSATYSFKLVLDAPYITGISFNDSGTEVLISGGNFEGVNKITFPGNVAATEFSVDTAYRNITVTIPPLKGAQDSIRVSCTFGSAAYTFPPPMTLTGVSNENATAGSTITITGTNLIGITEVDFPGGIQSTDITSGGVSKFTVKVPAGITAPGDLTVIGGLGKITYAYAFDSWMDPPSPGYLCNFENQWNLDNTGFVGWTGTYVAAADAGTNYPGAAGSCATLIQGSPLTAHAAAGSQGNPGFIQLNPVPWAASPASALIKDYSLKFEVFVKKPWSAGAIWITPGGWYGWDGYAARYAPWETDPSGKYQTTGWVTVTIPLSQMLSGNYFYSTSFTQGAPAAVISDYNATDLCFMLVNDGDKDVAAGSLDIAVDNIRIVKNK